MGLILTQRPGETGAAYLPGGTVRCAGLEGVSIGGGEGYWVPPRVDSPGVARSGACPSRSESGTDRRSG